MQLEDGRSHFVDKLRKVKQLVSIEAKFPDRVLKENILVSGFCESDIVFTPGFLSIMKTFMSLQQERSFCLLVIDPDPDAYFFSNFERFPLIEISTEDSEAELAQALDEDPGDSPADAIRYNSNRIVIFSDSLEWVIYLDRSYEIGILGARSQKAGNNLKTVFNGLIYSRDEVITEIFPLVFSDSAGAHLESVTVKFNDQYKS